MKVLFLDIDGVLNNLEAFRNEKSPTSKVLCSDMISRLNSIVEKSGCVVVLSSSWRMFGLKTVDTMLKDKGFKFDLVGQTPDTFEARGAEINAWMKKNNVTKENIVILDDDTDMLDLEDRLVKTSMDTGLTDLHVELVLMMFGVKES